MKDYWRGFLSYAAILSLFQDLRYETGERYAEYILNGGWIDRSITIPIALAILVVVILSKEKK